MNDAEANGRGAIPFTFITWKRWQPGGHSAEAFPTTGYHVRLQPLPRSSGTSAGESMASFPESVSMALFCDFENVALGVRDAKYEKFDIEPILERLLLKGSIVVKKAYCDWDRYKGFKAAMHEASFELIEIPHVRQSGKNSADIRLVVDALDLCYTKSHVDTFVIISGDSDFSPLVSKLRENAKKVIGVGVKNSTSDLLVANCDEFIFYDDLVREHQRTVAKREAREAPASARRASADEDKQPRQEMEGRKAKAIAIAVETFDALASERGESGKIWASVLKSAIKRRKPDFTESYYGFKAFGNLLEEAQLRGLLEVGRDEKSGAFVYRNSAPAEPVRDIETVRAPAPEEVAAAPKGGADRNRRKGRNDRKPVATPEPAPVPAPMSETVVEAVAEEQSVAQTQAIEPVEPQVEARRTGRNAPAEGQKAKRPGTRRGRQVAAKTADLFVSQEPAVEEESPAQSGVFSTQEHDETEISHAAETHPAPELSADTDTPPVKPARKTAARARRPRKAAVAVNEA
jgi:uncharacterized protein (TIGR00288 family)